LYLQHADHRAFRNVLCDISNRRDSGIYSNCPMANVEFQHSGEGLYRNSRTAGKDNVKRRDPGFGALDEVGGLIVGLASDCITALEHCF
jgi:hypothetical protein